MRQPTNEFRRTKEGPSATPRNESLSMNRARCEATLAEKGRKPASPKPQHHSALVTTVLNNFFTSEETFGLHLSYPANKKSFTTPTHRFALSHGSVSRWFGAQTLCSNANNARLSLFFQVLHHPARLSFLVSEYSSFLCNYKYLRLLDNGFWTIQPMWLQLLLRRRRKKNAKIATKFQNSRSEL